jgi:hypothetical protein
MCLAVDVPDSDAAGSDLHRSKSELDVVAAHEIPLYGSIILAGEVGTPYLYRYATAPVFL